MSTKQLLILIIIKMKLQNFIIALLCIISSIGFAQNIKGTIKSKSGEAISFANIAVLNSSIGTIANKDGNFTFALKKGKYQLQLSAVGYSSKLQQIIVADQDLTIEVSLSENTQTLDEVVVTADKVESNLQKTPIAITVLNAKKLEEYRVWNIADITALAPSVYTMEHGNTTGSNFLNIRGATGFTSEQAVATYVDGIYQFDFFSAPLNFNNIERIEILRGPQGTLYGRNAFSGVLNVITKKPSNKTTGIASVDFGNYGQQRYSTSFSAPIVKDKLFVGFGLQLNKRGSIYENPTLNTKNFDSREAISSNFSLKYLLSNKWTIDLNARTEINTDKGGYPWVTTNEIAHSQPYQTFGNYTNTEKRKNTNASINLKYFGNKFNFISTTGFVNYEIGIPDKFDFDFTASKLISGDILTKQNQITQEFRLSSPSNSGRFKWTVGSFLFADKSTTNSTTYFEEDFAAIDPNAPYSSITNGTKKAKGVAFYGQGTYEISSNLDVTFGTRYDVEDRELTQNSLFEKDGVTTLIADNTTLSRTFNAFTPKIVLNNKVNENQIIYVSYAKGFRVGGFNFGSTTNPNYNPEKSDNFEIGMKNNLLSNKLRINLTAFYFQQKDQQVSTSQDGVNFATLNVGNMNNLGFESEISAVPIKNLEIDWTSSVSESRYQKLELFDATTSTIKNYVGNRAIYNPTFQSMLAMQYNIPFKKSKQNISAFIRGEYRYLGEYQLNFENTESQKGYGLINSRAGITSKNIDIAFWVRNLNDARYTAWGTYGAYLLGSPRMFGVTLTGKF